MSLVIDQNEHYEIVDSLFVHCDEHQFRYYCKSCSEFMGCQFCEFDPYSQCDGCVE
jgi:hypothetical protein